MNLDQSEVLSLDQQAEIDRDRTYQNRSSLCFDFDDRNCCSEFERNLAAIAGLATDLSEAGEGLKLDLTSQPMASSSTWAIVDSQRRGLIIHHDTVVEGRPNDEGEFVRIFWSTVGLTNAFAACYSFGRYFLDGFYDLNLCPMVDVWSNLPSEQHERAVSQFVAAMASLGFPLRNP